MLTTLNNIGKVYSSMHMPDSAIYYYKQVIKQRLQQGFEQGLTMSYLNLATEYMTINNPELALVYLNKSYEISRRLNIRNVLARACNGLAEVYFRKGEIAKAEAYLKEGLEIADNIQNTEVKQILHEIAYKVYEAKKDYYQAHEHFKLYKMYEDSLVNMSNKETALKGQMQYEYDKKELLLKSEADKQNLIQKQEISRQRWIIYSVIGGLLIVLVFSFFLYNRFKIIRQQKHIIENQKAQVEEKQREILDSIKYARRIQQSLLPNEKLISRAIKKAAK